MRKTSRLGTAGSGTIAAGSAWLAWSPALDALVLLRPASVPGPGLSVEAPIGRHGWCRRRGSLGGEDTSLDAGDDGSSRSPRGGGSASLLGGIANATGPVIVVTLVIAAMSFYLIALVVWMALNYRSSDDGASRLGA